MAQLNPQTLENGQEQYASFTRRIGSKRKTYVQYDYRSQSGELFSTVKSTLDRCRQERDSWLLEKNT